jgi:hypothetical protein
VNLVFLQQLAAEFFPILRYERATRKY